jgi:GrpB-like predicted nucleotidyltransferase (UPF0157 family)
VRRFVCKIDDVVTAAQIVTFDDAPPPPGESPWVDGQGPTRDVRVVAADPVWPHVYAGLADRIIAVLGDDALSIEHIGSTSVPDLAAKPVIDIDLIVADSRDEQAYVPALEQHGFVLVVREPWWYEHRCLRHHNPAGNLHVFSPGNPEAERHRIFRDWLRNHAEDRTLYQAAKTLAADNTRSVDGHTMDYNGRKEDVVREIYGRAFRSLGLMN